MKPQRMFMAALIGALLLSSMLVLPAMAQDRLRDQEPGSFLVYPYFSISPPRTTIICVTDTADGPFNTNATWVRFNFICRGVKGPNPFCDTYDAHVPLTYHGTVCIDLSVSPWTPPCTEGFVVAFAETSSGVPQSHNTLIGHSQIQSPNVLAEANAVAVQSPAATGTALGTVNPGTGEYALSFGPGGDYLALPIALHGTFRAPIPGTQDTFLVVLTLDTIGGGQNPASRIAIDFWNANETRYSASWEFVCWDAVPLGTIDFRFTRVPLGTDFGSLRVTATSNCPIPGLCPPLPAFTPTILGTLVDVGPGAGLGVRNLFHTGARATTFFAE